MALKIWKDGAMSKIDTGLHKPVTFINGTKYKLDKAYTFVNGVKQEIWGEIGVQVDFISSTGVLGGGIVFAIGENWANASASGNVFKLDISNLSNPTLTQSVAWGNVIEHNGFLSTANNLIFHTTLNTSSHNRLSLSENGSLSVIKNLTSSYAATGDVTTSTRGFTENYVFNTSQLVQYVSPQIGSGTGRLITYGTKYYWNTEQRYSTGSYPNAYSYMSSGGLQLDANNIVVNLTGSGGSGFYKAAYSGLTKVRDEALVAAELLDGNVICGIKPGTSSLGTALHNAFVLTDKTSFAELAVFPTDYDTIRKQHKFLGKIGNYYYVLRLPAYYTDEKVVKLFLLNESDLSVAYEKDLPVDPFNENNGATTFWANATIFPQDSITGYLACSTFDVNTLSLRIARFSGIF